MGFRRATELAVIGGLGLLWAGTCNAGSLIPKREPGTVLGAYVSGSDVPHRLLSLGFVTSGVGTGTVVIHVPTGLTLAQGDTSYAADASIVAPAHVIEVQGRQSGRYLVDAAFRVGDRQNGVETAVRLAVVVTADSIYGEPAEVYRTEIWSAGKKFRDAGLLLVPMDLDETFDRGEFARAGLKAHPVGQLTVDCASCTAGPKDTLRFMVVVDRQGKVVASDLVPRDQEHQVPEVEVALARRRLEEEKLVPSRIGGRPVSDWTYTDVVVIPPR